MERQNREPDEELAPIRNKLMTAEVHTGYTLAKLELILEKLHYHLREVGTEEVLRSIQTILELGTELTVVLALRQELELLKQSIVRRKREARKEGKGMI